MKRLEVFLLLLDGMLVHRRSLPRNLSGFPNNLPVPIYTPGSVERGTVRVKCLTQEHNTMSPARARTRTARSGVERTNHEATATANIITVGRRKENYSWGQKKGILYSLYKYFFYISVVSANNFSKAKNTCENFTVGCHGVNPKLNCECTLFKERLCDAMSSVN